MRIRQRDDRYRKKKKKQQHGSTSSHHHNQAKQLHTEPAYRRKPNPIRRYDTDVLSPVRSCDLTFLSFSLLLLFSSHIFSPASHRVFGYCCILLCGIWNSAACSVNICVPATPTDQWSGLEMTQSLSPLITDFLFFLSQCIYQWLSFFLTTDVFLSRRSPSRATSRVSERGRCRRSPSRAGWWADPTLWWMWATTAAPRRPSPELLDLH